MPEYIYVLGIDGKPQMPTKRRRHVQKLLNTGKARIAEHVPFTIQLLYENEPVLQSVVMSEDPGRTKSRFEQKGESLETWFQKVIEKYGIKEAERMRSRLKVKKSTRYYNTPGRVMPGAVFYYRGERYVLSGQHCKGKYYRAVGQQTREFTSTDCKIKKQNEGLVFLG